MMKSNRVAILGMIILGFVLLSIEPSTSESNIFDPCHIRCVNLCHRNFEQCFDECVRRCPPSAHNCIAKCGVKKTDTVTIGTFF